MATVVVNEIQFDNVNEQIADLEIAEMVNEQNGLFSPNKLNNYVIPNFYDFWFCLNVFIIKIIKQY